MRLLFSLMLAAAAPQTDVAGTWAITVVDFGRPIATRLVLKVDGDKLSGTAGNQPLEGTVTAGQIVYKVGSRVVEARLAPDGRLVGHVTQGDRTMEWSAVRVPARSHEPRTHTFEPTKFELYFTSRVPPVLHIAPGDTVKTWSVGADGIDPKGERRSPGGNPQTGPFYVDGAMPGDTLVVRLIRLRTNRNWAVSGSSVMGNAVEPFHLAGLKWTEGFNSRWTIDAAAGVARLQTPPASLQDFTVPLKPMLGCVAVAPGQEWAIRTTDSGRFGGNMDYNQIVEGTTIYLPVNHPGALLFVGGFTVIFVSAGVLLGAFGGFLLDHRVVLQRVLGTLTILLGLSFAGALPFFGRELRLHGKPPLGLAGAPMLGMLFGLGWSPCIGPTLGAVMALGLQGGDAARGGVLAVAYCLGLGIPFVLTALGFGRAMTAFSWVRRHQLAVMRVGGGLLVLIGVLLVTGVWNTLTVSLQVWVNGFTPAV